MFDPITMLMKFNSITAASREVVATDIPASEIGTMIDLALKAKALPVSSVAMMPPLIDPSSPDFDKVRRNVAKKIEASEAIDTQVAEPTPKPSPSASPSRDAQTDDLGKVCSA